MNPLNNKIVFRQKLISSTIIIIFLITGMGIASLFSIWQINRTYHQNLKKIELVQEIYQNIILIEINLNHAHREVNNFIVIYNNDRAKRLFSIMKIKKKFTEINELTENIISKIKIGTPTDSLIKEIQKFQSLQLDLMNNGQLLDEKTKQLSLKKFNLASEALANTLQINRIRLQEENDEISRDTKKAFEDRYAQLRYFLMLTILFALCLSFLNLFKSLKLSSE